ncbi:hypothetical protein GCK32_013202, partial [Trichostrongylus colubriformis]
MGATQTPHVIRCFNCNGQGHLASVCPSPRTPPARRPLIRDAPTVQRRGPPRRLPQANLLSWDAGNRSDPLEATSPGGATASVARLTASLEDSQRQLRNSQARVEALLRRNDELAHVSLDRTPSSPRRAFAGSLPDVAEAGSRVATLVTEGSVIAGDNVMVAPAVTKAGSPPSSSHFRVHTQLSDSLRVTDTLHTSVLHDRNSSPRANNDDQTAAPPRTVPSREGQRPSLDERPGTLAPRQPPAPSDPAAAQPAASSAASSGTSTSHGAGITFGRSSEGIQPHPAHSPRAMTLRAELHTEPRSHEQLRNAVLRYGRVDEDRRTAEVRVCVRLTRAETGTDPVFELLANEKLFSEEELGAHSVARAILDSVYAGAPRDMRNVPPPPPSHVSVSLGPQRIRLCDDQARAVSLGEERPPVLAIQAAYGT